MLMVHSQRREARRSLVTTQFYAAPAGCWNQQASCYAAGALTTAILEPTGKAPIGSSLTATTIMPHTERTSNALTLGTDERTVIVDTARRCRLWNEGTLLHTREASGQWHVCEIEEDGITLVRHAWNRNHKRRVTLDPRTTL